MISRLSLLLALAALAAEAAPSPCTSVCKDLRTEVQQARCHSCRCKDNLDGWLPSADELTCGAGEEIKIFRSRPDQPSELDIVSTPATTCNNPSLFGGSCTPGSRLGQLRRGDIHFKWICRREKFRSNYLTPSVPYEKVSIIGTNTRTGATCFWENSTGTLSDASFPKLDQTHSSPEELKEFSHQFPVNEGWACLYCHDNDPFLYTSFLKSTQWETGDYVHGPYARVQLNGPPKETTQWHLNAPKADRCTSCHRISSGRTCKGFAQSAMGHDKDSGHETSVTDAMDQVQWLGGKKVRRPGKNWKLAYWMPPGVHQSSWEKWHQRYGEAKDTILQCCAEMGAGKKTAACDWQPIPGYAP